MTSLRKIWQILTASQRASALWLVMLMTVGMLLEMLCVALVVPFMAAMAGAQTAGQSATLARIRGWLGNPDEVRMVFMALGLLLAIYTVKAVFLVYLAWTQARFTASIQSTLSNRLFSIYLHQPWTFHLQHNSASLIHKATTEVQYFGAMVAALLSFFTELLVILGVGTLLLAYEPGGAAVAGVILGAATWLFQRISRNRIDSWGLRNREHSILRGKHLQQGLHGAKDVKILGREADFVERFRHDDAVVATMASRLTAANQLPRLWYELLAVAGLVVIGGILVLQGNTGPRLLSRLGLFAAAAFRMMPSANRILLTWQSLRYHKPSIESVFDELSIAAVEPGLPGPAIAYHDSIVMRGVAYQYPRAAGEALCDINLQIKKGRSLGIIGGSGAGKSTLVDVLLGLLIPSRGAVTVDGCDIQSNLRSWQNLIGYVPQTIYLTDDTVAANVAFGVPHDEIDLQAVSRALKAAQLDVFLATLPDREQTVVGERGVRLSGGQRQRIGIARALYRDPPVLVLDEATSSLDTETEKGVMAAVNELHGSKTLIIVAHRLSTVANCDELIRLEHGRIVKNGSFVDVSHVDSSG